MDEITRNIMEAKAATMASGSDKLAYDIAGTYMSRKALIFSDGDGPALWKEQLKASHPSDYFELDSETWRLALQTTKDAGVKGLGIPTDLFDAGMVPMEDCLLHIPEVSCYARFQASLGYFVLDIKLDTTSCALVFKVTRDFVDGKAALEPHDVKWVKGDRVYLTMADADRYLAGADTYLVCDDVLKCWYGLMVLLLNPATQEVLMERKGKEKLRQKCLCPKKTKERKAVYVKRHKLDGDIWDEVSRRNGIERRTLSWYVIGHWRQYGTGKRSFVKPHWKGPLRELARNVDTNRKREVVAVRGGKGA